MTENSPDDTHEPPAGGEYPSTLRITSKPFEESKEAALDRIEEWEDGVETPHVVNFQDASRVQRVLTPRRLELIESLMEDHGKSIRELADRLDRDVRQVHDDLQQLSEYRIVHFREDGNAKQPFVPYETVSIEVELVKTTDDSSTSPASV